MTNISQILCWPYLYVRSWIPARLPSGLAEFDAYAGEICSYCGVPLSPVYKQALAALIINLGPQTTRKTMRYFILSVKKAKANQISSEVLKSIEADKESRKQAAAQLGIDAG